jgi:hypothetical protein
MPVSLSVSTNHGRFCFHSFKSCLERLDFYSTPFPILISNFKCSFKISGWRNVRQDDLSNKIILHAPIHYGYTTSEIYSWSQISGWFRAWHMVGMFVACTSCSKWIFIFFVLCNIGEMFCQDDLSQFFLGNSGPLKRQTEQRTQYLENGMVCAI